MPTSVNVTNLKINELKEAQYDTAVQQGVIGANEISILTDAEAGQVIQVATLPTASADELDNIYQFVGTTDANYTNGYFYKCVSDGATPAVYSWTAVEVQAGGGLPTQTGNAGKFLTTDGTDASWSDKPLVNNENSIYSIALANGATANNNGSAIGYKCKSTGGFAAGSDSQSLNGVGIGVHAKATAQRAIAIGNTVTASGVNAIQLGTGFMLGGATNSDANTMKVANANGNFEIMSADGTVPSDRLIHAINKYSTMPTAASTNEGWIVQFTGTTDSTYTHGHLYECVSDGQDPATYSWTEVSMGGGGSSYTAGTGIDITGGVISVTTPTLTNLTTAIDGLSIIGKASVGAQTVAIGAAAGKANSINSVNIGYFAEGNSYSVSVGDNTQAGNYSVSLGHGARATATNAIQISCHNGYVSNSDANTMKVANTNGNYEMMSADGTIPAARHASLPATDGTYVLKLVITSGVPTLSWVAE